MGFRLVRGDPGFQGTDALLRRSAVAPDGGALGGGERRSAGALVGRGDPIPRLVGERVGGKNFQKLPGGSDHIIVPRGGGIGVDQFQRHLGALRVILLRARELRCRADQTEDLAFLLIDPDELQHQPGTGGRGLGGFLESGFERGGFLCYYRQAEEEAEKEDGFRKGHTG